MWPYWLDGHATNTVKNSFDMSSMYLLTGELTVQDGLHYCYYAIICCLLYHATNLLCLLFILYFLGGGANSDSSHLASKASVHVICKTIRLVS